MANNIVQVKRTSTTGRTPNTTGSYATNSQYIAAGELALNMTDGILYSSDGTNLIEIGANNTTQRITNALVLDNNKPLRFTTVNSSAAAYMIQQNDDNFVFYTTDASYGARAVFSIYANSSTSDFQIGQPLRFNGANVTFNSGTALYANGSAGAASQVLTSNGSGIYWAAVSGSGSTNVNAQYVWSNLHTFQANVSFTGNGIGIESNTGAIYLGGISDANWKIARNAGVTTKWRYTNNTIDIVTANSNLEGMTIGLVSGNSYFETGYLGTFIASNVTIGNTSSNATINSTAFSGSANNTTYVNGKAESNLNVNSAVYVLANTGIVSNSSGVFLDQTGQYTFTNTQTFSNTVFLNAISANGSLGATNQVLTSNGTTVYWSTPVQIFDYGLSYAFKTQPF